MRYIMKGGIWKNSEDEILKAAIMKYGLNQWSRISSLLQRKSAKQCKQRWYEWLDPSIKKTEWTRTEDEKLLQLARVFPSQWRTIAPFVGRTPTQCYQRYQKLLDIAQGKNPNDPHDLRKLRPGEIDPNPETKPARPDPIDMDEDEKEMLAQVRVRLANTKGKKAKRKEREKMIDEARRLAQLQKARELKMAGVENIITQQELKRLKQKKDIDYNKDIPFKRDVPDFVYKTEDRETPSSSSFALSIQVQAMEGKKRDYDQELNRQMEKRRLKKFRGEDPLNALLIKREMAKPTPAPISLPLPQLGDKDLEQLKKMNLITPLNTQLLTQTPMGMTPENKVLLSAKLNLSLNYNDIASVGREAADDMDAIEGLKEIRRLQKEGLPAPKRNFDEFRPMSQRVQTPVNDWDADDDSRKRLQRLLKGLRKPVNEIEFQVPEEDEEEEKEEVIDAEEYERIETENQEQIRQKRMAERSEVLKRNLPRPIRIPEKIYYHKRNPALDLIEREYISLLYSDAVDYPINGVEFPDREISYKSEIKKELLEEAEMLIKYQMTSESNPFKELSDDLRKKVRLDYLSKKVELGNRDFSIDNEIGDYATHSQQYSADLKKVQQLQKKCAINLAGYQKIIKNKTKEINEMLQQLEQLRMQKESLVELRQQEQQAIAARVADLQGYYKMIYDSL